MLNRAELIGHVGRDPEFHSMQTGGRVCNLSLATSERWTDKASGERKERTEWHRVVIFNEGLAGIVEKYVRKGSKLYVSGVIRTRKWTDQAGQDRYSTEIVLAAFGGQIVLLDGKPRDDAGGGEGYETAGDRSAKARAAGGRADLDDDIPF